jgi:hypothetical protein
MNEKRLASSDAAGELEEIKRRQAGVIDAVLVPRWYWWVVGVHVVPLGAVADSHQRLATAVVAVAVALVIAGITVWMVSGTYPGARIHPTTLGSAGSLYIVGFIWLVVGATLVVAFGPQAAGSPFPATIGTVLAAAMLIIGGPILMSHLRRVMAERSVVAAR